MATGGLTTPGAVSKASAVERQLGVAWLEQSWGPAVAEDGAAASMGLAGYWQRTGMLQSLSAGGDGLRQLGASDRIRRCPSAGAVAGGGAHRAGRQTPPSRTAS